MFIKRGRARLIAAAVLIHLGLALAVYLISRYALLAPWFDLHGTALPFASDAVAYASEVRSLVEILTRDGFSAWLTAGYPLHVKLYSVSAVLLSPLVGFSTLGAEPLNLFYYVAIVCLVYKLGEETFGERAGLVAATVVALWPSFLLHTTQLLKDPLYIAALLALLYLNLRWLTKDHGRGGGLLTGLAAGALCALLWIVRSDVWELALAVACLGAALVVLRQARRGRGGAWNLAGAALMLVLAAGVPRAARALRSGAPTPAEAAPSAAVRKTQTASLAQRAGRLRMKFARQYPDAGSNIDAGIEFDDTAGLIRYLPRALLVGGLAPFPDMWLTAGVHTGRAGRMLCGAETLLMYLLQLFAVYGLWSQRAHLPAWLLFLVALAGAAALGLVVVNVGALYRLRYAFWMLLVVLGAGGAVRLYEALAERHGRRARELLPDARRAWTAPALGAARRAAPETGDPARGAGA